MVAGRADGQDTVGHAGALRLLFATQRLALWLLEHSEELFAMLRHTLSLLLAMQRAGPQLSSIVSTSMHLLSRVASTGMHVLSEVARISKHLMPDVMSNPMGIAPAASPPSLSWPARPEVSSTNSVAVTKSKPFDILVPFWAGVLFAVVLAILSKALYTHFRATHKVPVSKLHGHALQSCTCTGMCQP